MNKFLSFFCLMSLGLAAMAQPSTTFEMRYFTSDPAADGVTDFHGETEWLDTESRVEMLGKYAGFASRFWGYPGMDTPLFGDADVRKALQGIKPQPLTSVRRTIPLEQWRSVGYKKGKKAETSVIPIFSDTLAWRFRLKARLREVDDGLSFTFVHTGGEETTVEVGPNKEFEIYGDLPGRVLFLSSGGKTLREIPVPDVPVTGLRTDGKDASFERISLYNFVLHEDDKLAPYWSEVVFDNDFRPVPSMEGWQEAGYDDSGWELVTLPSAHGGAAQAGEDYYLRTRVHPGPFAGAELHLEALDPAGEVWINGEPVAVLKGRIPYVLDVGEYLQPGNENVIAVKVKHFYTDQTMLHAPSDHNFGWFLGRASLVLTDTPNRIAEGRIHTSTLEAEAAIQHHTVVIRRDAHDFFEGSLAIRYSPWFPEEGPCVLEEEFPLELMPRVDNVIEKDLSIPSPLCWSPSEPRLYKVEMILKDADGVPVDDFVTTTGIRLIEQKKGVLYINHRPEILGGGQIFGFRLPLETVARTVYCPEPEQLMRDLMMARSLGNLLRVHIHARTLAPEGTNDPRIAEWADQMGLYLIWQTPAWTREGEAWNIDIGNYPVFMRQVFNHPSIVMWEAGNHPNCFRYHPASQTRDFMHAIIPAIALTDSSRLISPTTAWDLTHYGNYDGTVDYEGNPLEPEPWLMHRMMTRGSQDSYSGYEKPWSELRKIPYPVARWSLEAHDLCYFNFEHEESIAQPNWSLARKEPWYHMSSYEKVYEAGTIGRLLDFEEWRESQAYQAYSAWESMKMQIIAGVSGFSWCSLESGPNMFTYQKPLIDPFCVPKLAFHANRMAFQRIWAASGDVDTVYGPGDIIEPVIFNLEGACRVTLTVELQTAKGRVLERKVFRGVEVPEGRSVTRLEPFRFRTGGEGCRFIVYRLVSD